MKTSFSVSLQTLLFVATASGVVPFSQLSVALADYTNKMEVQCNGPKEVSIPEIQLRVKDFKGEVSHPVQVTVETSIARNHYYRDENEWGVKSSDREIKTTWSGNTLVIPAQKVSLKSRYFSRTRVSCVDQFRTMKVILNQATDKASKARFDLVTREIYFQLNPEATSENSFHIPKEPLKMDVVLKPMEVKKLVINKFIQTEKAISAGNSCIATHVGHDQNNQVFYLASAQKFGVENSLTVAAQSFTTVDVYGTSAEPTFNYGKTTCPVIGTHPLFYVESAQPATR